MKSTSTNTRTTQPTMTMKPKKSPRSPGKPRSIHAGKLHVYENGAVKATIQSGTIAIDTTKEYLDNSFDNKATMVAIEIHGNPLPTNPNIIQVTKYVHEDNGLGIPMDTILGELSGCYGDTGNHEDVSCRARDGKGSKVALAWFSEIQGQTTTAKPIPHTWRVPPGKEDVIQKVYEASPVNCGDPDTEIRVFTITMDGTTIHPPLKTTADTHFTKFTLTAGKTPVHMDMRKLRRLMARNSTRENIVILKYPVIQNNKRAQATEEIRPFMDRPTDIPPLMSVSGSLSNGFSIIPGWAKLNPIPNFMSGKWGNDIPGKYHALQESVDTLRKLKVDVSMEIRILSQKDPTNYPEFLINVSGSFPGSHFNEHDDPTELAINMTKLRGGMSGLTNGFFKVEDGNIKESLRHNRNVLSPDHPASAAFIRFVNEMFSILNHGYEAYRESLRNLDDAPVTKQLSKMMNELIIRSIIKKNIPNHIDSHPDSRKQRWKGQAGQGGQGGQSKSFKPSNLTNQSTKQAGTGELTIILSMEPVDGFQPATVNNKGDSIMIWKGHPSIISQASREFNNRRNGKAGILMQTLIGHCIYAWASYLSETKGVTIKKAHDAMVIELLQEKKFREKYTEQATSAGMSESCLGNILREFR